MSITIVVPEWFAWACVGLLLGSAVMNIAHIVVLWKHNSLLKGSDHE